jgi:hypothetical protein
VKINLEKMKRIVLMLIVASIINSAFLGCNSQSETAQNSQNEQSQNNDDNTENESFETLVPNKEQFVSDLKTLMRKLDTRKYNEARIFFNVPPSTTPDKLEEGFIRMQETNEISMRGIKILSEQGSFGKVRDIFPAKADMWLERANIIEKGEDGYAMKLDLANVAGLWNGQNFVFFRCDDIGKLEDNVNY